MDYKVVQVLLLLLLLEVCALGQAGNPEVSPPPPAPPPPSPAPKIDIPSPVNSPPPPTKSPPPPTKSPPPPTKSPTPPTKSPAPSPGPSGVDAPPVSPSPNPSPPSYQTGINNWTVTTNNKNFAILVSANQKFVFNLTLTNLQPYCVALVQHVPSKETVWVANFGNPPPNVQNLQNCTFVFKKDDLALTINAGDQIWNANPGDLLTSLELDDRGCLLLRTGESNSVWKSFDHPSDIIITEQTLNASRQIWAAQVNNQYLKGQGYMAVEPTQVILTNFTSEPEFIYNFTGKLISYVVMRNGLRFFAGNEVVHSIADFSYERKSLWQYARVDATGHLVIASYVDLIQRDSSNGEYYGLCSGTDTCDCPKGFRAVNDSACQRISALDFTGCMNRNSVDSFSTVSDMSYSGFLTNSAIPNFPPENCSSYCMHDCNCTLALHVKKPNAAYDLGTCYTNLGDSMQAVTKQGDTNTGLQTLFLRIHNGTVPSGGSTKSAKSSRKTAASAFAGGAGALVLVLLLVSAWYLYDSRRRLFEHAGSGKWDSATTELLSSRRLPQFTYQELVESTSNFHQKLGSGGFSSVYAGHLPDNTKIAVKKLDDNEQKVKEFSATVTTIGSVSHPNLVPLLGFCKEGQHRILVYELVNEGHSLNWYLFPSRKPSLLINAQTRRSIALGAARGLAHLHEDCNVVHGGVKPENIVIDRNFHPRLVDFGLGTLMSRDQRISAATMHNSHCYMAPEWAKSQPVTEKADIYSLGVVILELVSGRRCLKQGASPETSFLPTWGFSLLRHGMDDSDCVLELVDPRLNVRSLPATDQQLLKGMIFVALWCVQENASLRPPTKEVVRMLEGDTSVDTPPLSPALDAFARELCAGSSGERAPESSNNSFMHSTSLSKNSDMLLR